MIKRVKAHWVLFSTLLLSLPLHAQKSEEGYGVYVEQLKSEAIVEGFEAEFVEQAFADITFYKRAIKADKNQPESKITLDKYLHTRVPDWKVKQAVDLYHQHQQVLDKIGAEYGVQPRFIVALWGNESNFGKIMGNYSIVSALSTLAYEGRREAFFKKQLFAALTILEQGHIQKPQFLGSWAGAMGQSQFMPTSFLTYAVDYDNDGKKDIWSNPEDVFASIANYLSKEGWDDSITWGRQVRIPADFDLSLAGLAKSKMQPLSAWQGLGVRRYDGSDLPNVDLQASLIMPDDENGRIYLVYSNFHTLMRWNRSTYFGSAVSYLADRIKKGS
ncbi:lytic transglycosylase domain-containing protein [Aliiglaciecola sp. SL4]|uniref:lytic murein transglycosylase n=1 Tax=Aliiglaciecola sp. SL4 TaxID=3239806 RepID=UPI00355BA9C9